MARPLRLEFPGAIYHIMSRGDRREDIYDDHTDRENFLEVIGSACTRFNWVVHAYCLMGNHYHLVIETPDGNLVRGMRHLNGVYTQRFNRRHGRAGHVFQGRYKSVLVQRERYLLELVRYVVLNPVRAGVVDHPYDWLWSSYRAHVGSTAAPEWLDSEWVLRQFSNDRSRAVCSYKAFVDAGLDAPDPTQQVQGQLYLGDGEFGERLKAEVRDRPFREISKAQRRPLAAPIEEYARSSNDPKEAMAKAYFSGAFSMREIAEFFGVHYMTVSRAVRRNERMLDCET